MLLSLLFVYFFRVALAHGAQRMYSRRVTRLPQPTHNGHGFWLCAFCLTWRSAIAHDFEQYRWAALFLLNSTPHLAQRTNALTEANRQSSEHVMGSFSL